MFTRFFLFLCFLTICNLSAHSQPGELQWVDSVYNSLNADEKIGQLFMLVIPPHASSDDIDRIRDDVKSHEVGGIIFQQETPHHQASVTRALQAATKIPLFVGQDGEWGIAQQVDSAISFPRPLILGAIHSDSLVYQMGKATAKHMKVIGLNLDFAPLTDINNNPQDPLISYRSFGEDKVNVAHKATAYMRGLQDGGVLACAKQYAVQSLTVTDFVKDIPRVQPTIDTVSSYPFTMLFENGVTGVMPASSKVPLFYENLKLNRKNDFDAETLSLLFTGRWLKEKQNFKGLTFVDLQQVKIAADKEKEGDESVFAFQAGNDVLIGPEDVGPAIRKIKKLVKSDSQYERQLDETVKKILSAKYKAGLYQAADVNTDNLIARLNDGESLVLRQKLYESAVTVVKDNKKVIPIKSLENKNFAYITSDAAEPNKIFYNYLTRYVNASYYTLDEKTDLVEMSDALTGHQVIIVGVFPQTTPAVLARIDRLLSMLAMGHEVVYCDFGNEMFLKTSKNYGTLITAYSNTEETLKAVPEVIFGALPASGKLPFSVPTAELKAGTGISTGTTGRLSYSLPEDVAMSSEVLSRIETIAREAIETGATPGCQVLVARKGKVIYQQNFGTLNYNKLNPVTDQTIYDLASLTKVSATLQATMFMYEKGLIDINRKVSYYLPELKKTNKKDVTILEMLTHQAGLAPFIPMWNETVKDTEYLPLYYSRSKSEKYPLQVSSNLYAAPGIRDSVWSWIAKSKLIEKSARTPYIYKYSDLGFLILQRLAERLTNQPLDEFVSQNFYEPLGAYTTGYLPLAHFSSQQIAPTEDDRIYRKTLVTGTVHDERAAMMGGVAGHAGLFSSANDLAKLGQMLLQEGYYGGYRYYKPETVRMFTHKAFDRSRRGLGWDKPIQSDFNGPTSLKASPKTFGHTGFTGTCMWVDPEFDLVYVFLSNRVYPDRSGKLISANIRSRIQDVIYDAIFSYCDEGPAVIAAPENNIVSRAQ